MSSTSNLMVGFGTTSGFISRPGAWSEGMGAFWSAKSAWNSGARLKSLVGWSISTSRSKGTS